MKQDVERPMREAYWLAAARKQSLRCLQLKFAQQILFSNFYRHANSSSNLFPVSFRTSTRIGAYKGPDFAQFETLSAILARGPMARRIEIIAFERERFVKKTTTSCRVCGDGNPLLTTAQAAAMAQVCARSVYRWLAEGKVHSAITPGGHHRICRSSLLRFRDGWRAVENPSAASRALPGG